MTTEEKAELQRDAQSLAYLAIRHSGLWKSLTNQQWDAKAAVYGHLLVDVMQEWIGMDETALEEAREAEREARLVETLEGTV